MRTCTKCQVAYDDTGFYGKHPHCKVCQKKDHKKYYDEVLSKNPEKRRAYSKKWRAANTDRARELQNNYYAKIRLEILTHYSNGKPTCVCCGETEIQFLSFDHIDGGGNEHRRSNKIVNLMMWLRANGYPKGYQILCHNCNFSKGHYGQCPHINERIKT